MSARRAVPSVRGRTGSSYERIYAAVCRIPRGRVASYGEIAALAGLPRAARQVGYALSALPEGSRVPWQRVVNARGAISARSSGFEGPQRLLLEREGVRFDAAGRIDLSRFGWPERAPLAPARRPRERAAEALASRRRRRSEGGARR